MANFAFLFSFFVMSKIYLILEQDKLSRKSTEYIFLSIQIYIRGVLMILPS